MVAPVWRERTRKREPPSVEDEGIYSSFPAHRLLLNAQNHLRRLFCRPRRSNQCEGADGVVWARLHPHGAGRGNRSLSRRPGAAMTPSQNPVRQKARFPAIPAPSPLRGHPGRFLLCPHHLLPLSGPPREARACCWCSMESSGFGINGDANPSSDNSVAAQVAYPPCQ